VNVNKLHRHIENLTAQQLADVARVVLHGRMDRKFPKEIRSLLIDSITEGRLQRDLVHQGLLGKLEPP